MHAGLSELLLDSLAKGNTDELSYGGDPISFAVDRTWEQRDLVSEHPAAEWLAQVQRKREVSN